MSNNATTNEASNVTSLPSTPKAQTAKEVIAANVKLLIEQLEAGHSEGLTAYLTAMGRFHSYSLGNILEIARQRPSATRVAGMYAWNQLGRRINKGEKGIRILAPMIGIRRKKDSEAEKDITKQNQPVLVGFRTAHVFERLSRDLQPRFYALG
jgi:N-terminal domain of anti-restriction factor ArdC